MLSVVPHGFVWLTFHEYSEVNLATAFKTCSDSTKISTILSEARNKDGKRLPILLVDEGLHKSLCLTRISISHCN